MINFFKNIKSKEYLELAKDLERLRISFEGLRLEFDLIKKKLRVKNKLDTEQEQKDIYNDVLLKE